MTQTRDTGMPTELGNSNLDMPNVTGDETFNSQRREGIIHSAAGDIHVPNTNLPVDMNFEFVPQNPYTISANAPGGGLTNLLKGKNVESGFFETAAAEAADWNFTYQAAHAGYSKYTSPDDDLVDPAWSPKSDPSKFLNIKPEYYKYLFEATGPNDLDARILKVMNEQHHDEILANGSAFAKVLGGLGGIITDPISYIPIVGWAKYAKLAPTFLKAAGKALPGVATASVLQSAASQADKVNGNMVDFATNAFINTVFGSVLFGTLGAAGVTADKLKLWNLRKLAKEEIDGIDFHLNVDEEGKLTGFKAVKTNEALNAARVDYAQDLANSAFDKSGVFSVPYLGEAVTRFLTMPILGTPLPKLLNSKYKTLAGFIDRVVDHTIRTVGMGKGETAPIKFETLMKQQFSKIRSLSVQMDAMHLERNGFDIKSRPIVSLINAGMSIKNKGLEMLGQDLGNEYISKEKFYSEIEEVLYKKTPSKHGSVNEAASQVRTILDDTYSAYRKAYDLPEDWLPPRTAEGYLMRVYDTPYMNAHEEEWISSISNWLKESDELITKRMEPITDLENKVKYMTSAHEDLKRAPGTTTDQITMSVRELEVVKRKLKSERNKLQDELRSDPKHNVHVDDWTALSSKEAKELKKLLEPQKKAVEAVDQQKLVVDKIKQDAFFTKGKSNRVRDAGDAKELSSKYDELQLQLKDEEEKLRLLKDEVFNQEDALQQLVTDGKVSKKFYTETAGSNRVTFKDPNNRLKFRDVYPEHADREKAAKAYYDTILNQTPADTIAQVMSKVSGAISENHAKQRTLMIPDEVLYKNGFMSKDLMAKVSNYVTHLSRRTNLKTVFKDVTVDGGVEHLLENMNVEHEKIRSFWNESKSKTNGEINALKDELKLSTTSKSDAEKINKKVTKLEKKIDKIEKRLNSEREDFDEAKKQFSHVYDKMMGLKKTSRNAQMAQKAIMSFTAMANLPFVPFTMINDLSAQGLQHGIWPFIRDGVYPIIQSLGGVLKTKDSEALRKSAPSVHLALQDVLNGYADKNWSMHTDPYLNMGKIVNTLEKVAHFSSNFTLTSYLDNGLQHIAGSITQSEFMRILHAFKAGKMTKTEGLYLSKYNIDPHQWADRMIAAFEKDGGGKTALGGYQSSFWHWQDLEASNVFSNAVFRGIQDTTIQRGLADSPFWADNVILSLVHGFSGWMFASVNRYVIPSLQQPDAQKLAGVMFMLATGSLVSPLRRMAKGEDMIPDNMTDKQRLWETIQDSGYFSYFSTIMADANLLSGGSLLGDLKNDKYKDRTRAGLLGPSWGTANRMADIVGALASNEMNEADALKMGRMLPIANASWTWRMSKKFVESLGLPKTRAQAKAMKNI